MYGPPPKPHTTRELVLVSAAHEAKRVRDMEERLSLDITSTVSRRLRKTLIAGVAIAVISTVGAGVVNYVEISQNMSIEQEHAQTIATDHADTDRIEGQMSADITKIHAMQVQNSAQLKQIEILTKEVDG
jgi:hypothetical protein